MMIVLIVSLFKTSANPLLPLFHFCVILLSFLTMVFFLYHKTVVLLNKRPE